MSIVLPSWRYPAAALAAILLCAPALSTTARADNGGGDYYLAASLGYSYLGYSSNPALQTFQDNEQSYSNFHFSTGFEAAFIWALGDHQTGVGVGLSDALDRYVPTSSTTDTATVTLLNVVATARHYFGDELGHGFFVRGDVGVSWISTTTNLYTSSVDNNASGLYLLGGGGYGFRLSEHLSLPLEADLGRAFVSSGGVNLFQAKVGVLFYF